MFVCTVEIVISGFKNLAIFCLLFNFRLQKKTSTSEHRSIKVRLLPARANALYMSANLLSFLCAWVFLSGHLQDDKTWGKRKQRGSRKISALMTSVRTRASSYISNERNVFIFSVHAGKLNGFYLIFFSFSSADSPTKNGPFEYKRASTISVAHSFSWLTELSTSLFPFRRYKLMTTETTSDWREKVRRSNRKASANDASAQQQSNTTHS